MTNVKPGAEAVLSDSGAKATCGVPVLDTSWRGSVRRALIVTRREAHDSLRDWRIVVPILVLTLIFPFLMDFTASAARSFVLRYGGSNALIADRLNPFLLMIVGFFPISFSLVIALETFVGEKERKSLEPLLATPVSDGELYLGKMLAALFLPVLASALGIGIYLAGVYLTAGWRPGAELLCQIWLLTAAEALVMVSGAVVVSSQTTSVRAANLLASFIIIPTALLVQTESVLMFWGAYNVIWWVIAGLLVADVILVRMGVRIFSREEILAREIDELNLRAIWRTFLHYLVEAPDMTQGVPARPLRLDLARMYRHDLPGLIRQNWRPLAVVLVSLTAAVVLGGYFATRLPIPPGLIHLDNLSASAFESVPNVDFLPNFSVTGVFLNNLRSLALEGVLAIFSFGALALILLMIPMALVGYFTVEMGMLGYSPLVFLATFILPHGIFELPAAVIATTFALRIGAALVAPPSGLDVGHGFLMAVADFCKIFLLLVVPLLLVAAALEINVTPQIVLAVYGQH